MTIADEEFYTVDMPLSCFSDLQLEATVDAQIEPLNLEIGESAEATLQNIFGYLQTIIVTRTK